jgi:hypothetical protein
MRKGGHAAHVRLFWLEVWGGGAKRAVRGTRAGERLEHIHDCIVTTAGKERTNGLNSSFAPKLGFARNLNLWLGKSPLFPHSRTFRFFAHGVFVLEPWTNAIKGKNCLRLN